MNPIRSEEAAGPAAGATGGSQTVRLAARVCSRNRPPWPEHAESVEHDVPQLIYLFNQKSNLIPLRIFLISLSK